MGVLLQDGHKNSLTQGGLHLGTQEAVFCIQAKAEKFHKYQISTMLLIQSSRFNSNKIKPPSVDTTKLLLKNCKIDHTIKIAWPFPPLILPLSPPLPLSLL